MPIGMCVWCRRSRLVQLRTWRSPRSGAQLCGEVCSHCYFGTGHPDDCRTCRAKAARGERLGQRGVRPLQPRDILQLLSERIPKPGRRGA
jgi:hypothetical protein